MASRIAITGLSGTIGKRLLAQIPAEYEVVDLYREHPSPSSAARPVINVKTSLLDVVGMRAELDRLRPDIVLHMAAKTHIDRCEEDNVNGVSGEVWRTNVDSLAPLLQYASEAGAYVIFLSTECVFDGKKEAYTEQDKKSPVNWYGATKSRAEDAILASGIHASILRAVITYHEHDNKETLFGKIAAQLESKKPFSLVNDQRITPTYTDDIIRAILLLFKSQLSGIFHVAPSQAITPFYFGQVIARRLGFEEDLVSGVSLVEYFGEDRARLRVKNAVLDSTQTRNKLGFSPVTIDQVLERILKEVQV